MSIRPAFSFVSSRMNTSPIGVTALYLPSTEIIFLTNFVLHFGRFSMFDKNANTVFFGTVTTQVSVTEFNVFCHDVDYLNGVLRITKEQTHKLISCLIAILCP